MNSKNEIKNLWDSVAENFSKNGPNYWQDFGKRLVEVSKVSGESKVLDIGVGRGASLYPILDSITQNGFVTAIDISSKMIEEMRNELNYKNIENASVVEMDAATLEFQNEYFDYIISGFSIWHSFNENLKLSEVFRTLKKEGILAFSSWGVQEDQQSLNSIAFEYLNKLENNSDKKNSKAVSGPILNVVEGVENFIKDNNLEVIRVFEEIKPVIYKSKEQWWFDMSNNAASNIFAKIRKLGDEVYSEYVERVNAELENYKHDDGYCFNMKVIYAVARK